MTDSKVFGFLDGCKFSLIGGRKFGHRELSGVGAAFESDMMDQTSLMYRLRYHSVVGLLYEGLLPHYCDSLFILFSGTCFPSLVRAANQLD